MILSLYSSRLGECWISTTLPGGLQRRVESLWCFARSFYSQAVRIRWPDRSTLKQMVVSCFRDEIHIEIRERFLFMYIWVMCSDLTSLNRSGAGEWAASSHPSLQNCCWLGSSLPWWSWVAASTWRGADPMQWGGSGSIRFLTEAHLLRPDIIWVVVDLSTAVILTWHVSGCSTD